MVDSRSSASTEAVAGGNPSLADDEAKLAEYAMALADAIEAHLADWVRGCVELRIPMVVGSVRDAVAEAAAAAVAETAPAIRTLLATDIADQRANPLDLLRRAVVYPTTVLRDAGVAHATRDEFAERVFPDDVYGLSPASFGDVHPALHEPGLTWGAAKAHVHLRRRREQEHQ